MDFFQAQESARARSRRLVLLFIVAVMAIIATIYAVVHFAFGPGVTGPIDWTLLLIVALGTSVIVAAGSGVRTLQLRQGGARVAEMLGGRRVRMDTSDAAERRLVNVVEEMSIASGTPVPAIYVLDNESGINAFAAGYTLDDAAVAVTRGTLQHLNRDELQGVIAHEFSHVLNGDMRLNIRLIGLLFGILLLAIAGRFLLYSGSGRGRSREGGGGQIALLGLALVAVGYIGVFFGKLIQSAVSRQREYLADAAAVQFTRNPDGLAGALKKIGGFAGSRIENHHAQEASHLFFASGLKSSRVSPLSTHPSLEDRIRRLDPSFDGNYPAVPTLIDEDGSIAAGGRGSAQVAGLAGGAPTAGIAGAAMTGAAVAGEPAGFTGQASSQPARPVPAATFAPPGDASGAALIASIGSPRREHMDFASRFLASLPDTLHDAAHDPDGATALLYALLLHDDGAAADRQHEVIDMAGGAQLFGRVRQMQPELASLGPASRLPLLDLLLPSLRDLSPDQAREAYETAESLVEADGRMDVFELALLHVLRRQLASGELGRSRRNGTEKSIDSFASLRNEVEIVLSAVAWWGAVDERAALRAFDAARSTLPKEVEHAGLRAREAFSIHDVDEALARLRIASPSIRRLVLQACADAVAHDQRVSVQEAELLRAVAEAVDCPMPPVL